MNYTLIIMGIILVVLIYILYKVIDEKGKVVMKKMDLNVSNPPIGLSTLTNPTSNRYYFSLWIYANSYKSSNVGGGYNSTLFRVADNTEYFRLSLTDKAELQYSIGNAENTFVARTIMPNFPLQKWVCVMVSVDNDVIDMYIDGKLIRSEKLTTSHNIVSKEAQISFYNYDAYIAKFEREPKPMDPTLAWNKYMEGNGGNYFSKMFSSYGASFTLKKDDLDIRHFNLF